METFQLPRGEMQGTAVGLLNFPGNWILASKLVLDVLAHSSSGQQPVLCLQVVGWGNTSAALAASNSQTRQN